MNKIQVDPKLFITCRLCLSEMGVYQIDPSVQEQIKFCFDIDVHPFDRLPQLICQECEGLLSNFHGKKKLFQEKQNALLSKLQIEQNDKTTHTTDTPSIVKENGFAPGFVNPEQTQQETVTSSQSSDIIVKERRSKPKSKKRITETPDNSTIKESEKTPKEKKKRKIIKQNSLPNILESLGPTYIQRFTCKICNKHFGEQSEIVNHCRNHDVFISQHKSSLNPHCSVVMEKIDDSPNVTGTTLTVVINKNKILQNSVEHYYITYHPKRSDIIDSDDEQFRQKKKHKKIKPISDDSSEDDFSVSGNYKKRQRLLSKSSTETVVLEDNDNKNAIREQLGKDLNTTANEKIQNVVTECINIDDSSDNESIQSSKAFESTYNSVDKPVVMGSEYKIIQNIMSGCHGKHMKKLDTLENDNTSAAKTKSPANFESLLKHKILSIGRKIINKQTFNCNGILRFLDHKNLDIDWKPVKPSEENNHVKILTQMIEPSKRNLSDDKNDAWKKSTEKITPSSSEQLNSLPEQAIPALGGEQLNRLPEQAIPALGGEQLNSLPEQAIPALGGEPSCNSEKKRKTCKPQNKTNDSTPQLPSTIPLNITECAVLYLNTDTDNGVKNKLLNKNPVANPKKLPKKSVNTSQASEQSSSFVQQRVPDAMCMPIITSTTSLADPDKATAPVAATPQRNDSTNAAPRIKVKPVSELMADKTVVNVNQQFVGVPSSVWDTEHADAVHSSATPAFRDTVNQPNQIPVRVTAAPAPGSVESSMQAFCDNESLILHTVELPNTKTKCPFSYLKNLLQLHSIILYNSQTTLTPEFACLIKFKVHFSNGSNRPVVLSSCLMCNKNLFCIKMRDNNQREINITALPAKWQWQLLLMFKGDVAEKLLENSVKISRDAHYHAKIFISMLKSIKVYNFNEI